MAAQGVRDTGDGVEKIANAAVVADLRARARTVSLMVAASAVATTALIIAAVVL